jgi:RNA polymerase sigma factor (sigma-70 family)
MATAAPEISVLARDRDFESLYRRYVKDVYHYALALLRNPADAEDVTQTTFLNAYRAFSKGIEVEKPQNWLIKIAHNVARTRYARSSRRVREVPLDDHVEHLSVPEESRPDVHGVLEALGELPFNQRAALVMRELEGRSYAEISDTIGVSVSAVETLIFRARRSLRIKSSALRSLAAVPLPTSLKSLFEGGGVVAGGGALAGTGFAVKAAVAIVAGLVATGISSDRSGPAAAAHHSAGLSVAGDQARNLADGTTASLKRPSAKSTFVVVRRSRGAAGAVRRAGEPTLPASAVTGSAPGTTLVVSTGAGASPATTTVSTVATVATKTQSAAAAAQQAVTSTVAQVAQPAADQASSAVNAVTTAVPLPPPPPVPQVPIDVPKLPGGPKLP